MTDTTPAGTWTPDMQHCANEWADMAVNGLQWLRNVKDGTSNIDDALANMDTNLRHCRQVNTAVNDAARQALVAQPAALCTFTDPPALGCEPAGAQPAAPVEPVGEVESAVSGAGGFHVRLADGAAMPKVGTKLYTTPQQAQERHPLSDEQILEILSDLDPQTKRVPPGFLLFARMLEAAHGIKGATS